jgi:hypothetical protein
MQTNSAWTPSAKCSAWSLDEKTLYFIKSDFYGSSYATINLTTGLASTEFGTPGYAV